MAPRGETHARAESVVRGWICEIRELEHSYEMRELDPPPMGHWRLRFGLDLSRRWLVMAPGIPWQWRMIVCTFYPMGDTGRATAARYIKIIA
jgi:hypothetical protein